MNSKLDKLRSKSRDLTREIRDITSVIDRLRLQALDLCDDIDTFDIIKNDLQYLRDIKYRAQYDLKLVNIEIKYLEFNSTSKHYRSKLAQKKVIADVKRILKK